MHALSLCHAQSYTPLKMVVAAGNTQEDLVEVRALRLHEPTGWINCRLRGPPDEAGRPTPLRARMLQVAVLCMHQNGRDTHMRQVKVSLHSPLLRFKRCGHFAASDARLS